MEIQGDSKISEERGRKGNSRYYQNRLPPITRGHNLSVSQVNQTIESVDKQIDFFLMDTDRQIKLINQHKSPKVQLAKVLQANQEIQKRRSTRKNNSLDSMTYRRKMFQKNRERELINMRSPAMSRTLAEGWNKQKSIRERDLQMNDQTQLILKKYYMDEALCGKIGNAIQQLRQLQTLKLQQCNISDAGGASLLEAVFQHGYIRQFGYSYNQIGQKFAQSLKQFPNTQLLSLSLQKSKTIGSSLFTVIKTIQQFSQLRVLNLSGLGLNNLMMEKASKVLKLQNILDLNFSHNDIPFDSSKRFFKALKRNSSLRSLDYSWNKLSSTNNQLAILIAQVVSCHTFLMHLDLSHTKLSDSDGSIIINSLTSSKTMMSLHLTGNSFSHKVVSSINKSLGTQTDPGFIANSAQSAKFPMQAIEQTPKKPLLKRFNSLARAQRRKVAQFPQRVVSRIVLEEEDVINSEGWTTSGHCWICQRWNVQKIGGKTSLLNFVTSVSSFTSWNPLDKKLVLKASFNQWQEIQLPSEKNFEVKILLPPGRHICWFVLDQRLVCINKEFERVKWNGIQVNEFFVKQKENWLESIQNNGERRFNKEKTFWKAFIEDNEQRVLKMYENDYKFMKLNLVVQNVQNLNELNEFLVQEYLKIKEIFDFHASQSNYPSIGWFDFSKFCGDFDLFDDSLTATTLGRIFIAANQQLQDLQDNPDSQLCRYEFFQIISRMGICKYPQKSPVQATSQILQQIYLRSIPIRPAQFRKKHLYNLQVTDFLQANLSTLQLLFAKNQDKKGKWITPKGIQKFIQMAGLKLDTKTVMKLYSFSKMSILDEMNANGAYQKMIFIEFLVFLCQVAHLIVEEGEFTQKLTQMLTQILGKFGLKLKQVNQNYSYRLEFLFDS